MLDILSKALREHRCLRSRDSRGGWSGGRPFFSGCTVERSVGALIITYTISWVPYYKYSILYPKTLF